MKMLRLLFAVIAVVGIAALVAMYNGLLPERTVLASGVTLNLGSILLALTVMFVIAFFAPAFASIAAAGGAVFFFFGSADFNVPIAAAFAVLAVLFLLGRQGSKKYFCAACGQYLGMGSQRRHLCERCGSNRFVTR